MNPYGPKDELMLLHLISTKLILEIEKKEWVSEVCDRVLSSWRAHELYSSLSLAEKANDSLKEIMSGIFETEYKTSCLHKINN